MNLRRQLLSVPALGAAIAGFLSLTSFGGTTGVSAVPAEAAGTVPVMPVATVTGALGGIMWFVATSGSNLVLVDSTFANPVVIGTLAAPDRAAPGY